MARIAPLNALRAFEAAARHLSFAKAADELHVTPGAVSRQIKVLEAYVGAPLFHRMTRSIALTDLGQQALPPLRDGVDKLAVATELLMKRRGRIAITVSVTQVFAAKWLMPRLHKFHAAHPDIDVRIDASERALDFAHDGIDLAIRYGSGDYRGLKASRLLDGDLIPVCSPCLLSGSVPLQNLEDLAEHNLLHVDWKERADDWPDWRTWLSAAGLHDVDFTRGSRFTHEAMALQMAIDGHGIALAESVLVADDLAAGRLVCPFDISLALPLGHDVIWPEYSREPAELRAFREWLFEQALCSQDHRGRDT